MGCHVPRFRDELERQIRQNVGERMKSYLGSSFGFLFCDR